MTNEMKQQFTRGIAEANSTTLVVILYEMSLEYLKDGEEALKGGTRDAFREAVRHVRGCINELMRSLNLDYEPAPTLLQLYLYCIRRLANAEFNYNNEGLRDVLHVIQPLKDAYSQIESVNQDGAVMENSETIYAGLTYGRNSLNEAAVGAGNRGFLA